VHLVHRVGLRRRGLLGPGFFKGEGYATIYDVNLQPKPAYFDLQQGPAVAAFGAPRRHGGF